MAKWGKGDPRWIVEERPDATNVNNWHWKDIDATEWSKEKINKLFNNHKIQSDLGSIKLGVKKCEGEATVCSRKKKIFLFYGWQLILNWKATSKANPDKEINGELEVLTLSEENELEEIDIEVSIEKGGPEADNFKEFIRKKGIANIRNKLSDYITALKEEFAPALLLPTNDSGGLTTNISSEDTTKTFKEVLKLSSTNKKEDMGVKMNLQTLTMKETFKCSIEDIYNVLTSTELTSAFTRSPSTVNATKGGEFVMLGGNIHGIFELLEPPHTIKQKWRKKDWASGHFSTVTFKLEQTDDSAVVHLTQKDIPEIELDRVKEGWNNYYWQGIKRAFGYGALLF